MDRLVRLACLCALVLAPLRYRYNLQPRSYPPVYDDYTDLLLFISDIPLIIALSIWAIGLVLSPRRISTGPPLLTLPLAGVTIFSLISILASSDRVISSFQFGRMLALDGLYLVVINQFSSLRPLALAAGLQLALQAGIGSAQVFRQGSLGLQALGEHVLDPNQSGVSVVWSSLGRSLRAYGLTDHPNILGGCLAFGLILLAAWLIHRSPVSISFMRLLGLCLFCLGSQTLLLTFSRSAWAALLGGFLVWGAALLYSRSIAAFRRLAGVVSVGFLVCLPVMWHFRAYILPRLDVTMVANPQANESRALNERSLLNRAANEIFAQHIFTGVGLGVYPLALKNAQPDFPIYYQPAHFTLLAAAAEIGIFGALSYTAASILPLLAFAAYLARRPGKQISLQFTAATVLLVAIFITGWFDYYTWMLTPGRLWQWIAWGIWGAANQLRETGESR